MTNSQFSCDVIILGGGAAGLMAAIWAARTNSDLNIVIVDGAKKLGAKILVAGGGRCNVTHYNVSPDDFAGSSRNSIKKVLLRFDVEHTIEFFHQLGVELKREETGKLFPVSNSARNVLNALLDEANNLGIQILPKHRIDTAIKTDQGFVIAGEWGSASSRKLIMATGGKSLPKSGSDGKGFEFCKQLGHSLTENLFPALVPLLLPKDHFICQISGVSVKAKLDVINVNNKSLKSFTNSILCTHFGISGPVALDISRYFLVAQQHDSDCHIIIDWLPGIKHQELEEIFLTGTEKRTVRNLLSEYLPVRLTEELCKISNVEFSQRSNQLSKVQRKKLLANLHAMELPIVGDRGYQFSEVTAGGVPLSEIDLKTMHSRLCSDLYLCGEVCNVDGRIGGFNFQWAWASGYICGLAAAVD